MITSDKGTRDKRNIHQKRKVKKIKVRNEEDKSFSNLKVVEPLRRKVGR